MLEPICDSNPCGTPTGSMVTVSAPTPDASCIYAATATCDNPYPRVIQYNGGGVLYMSPQTLKCDTGTGQYTYTDGGSVQQQIATIDCVCDSNPCGTLTGSTLKKKLLQLFANAFCHI
uniref:ET module n=1 Tax=Panagrolaimus davidi TaxID=227884 RepID=A0A914QM32_9BILA